MLRVDRLSIYIVMFGLIFLIPSVYMFDKTDELTACMLIALAGIDMISNGNFRKYKGFLWLVAILTAYGIYSLYLPYNKPEYILVDWLIQIKSFACFLILFAINPQFTERDKHWIKNICAFNMIVLCAALCCGWDVTMLLVFHPAYAGTIIFTSACFYVYVSIDEEGRVPRKVIRNVVMALVVGCLCLKAKYFGMMVLVAYFIFLYKPGVMRNFSPVHLFTILIICSGVLAVSWNKINYYYIQGEAESFDPEAIYSYARPVMFMTGGLILVDHFPFGTGLASFGTAASQPGFNYSNVYYEYGIDKVHGINPNSEESFICDAFFPELAQFGVVGLILFIVFWVWAYSFLRPMARYYIKQYRPQFIIGSCIIIFLLLESTAATTIVHTVGLECLSLLGIICATGRTLKNRHTIEESKELQPQSTTPQQLYKI